MRVRVPPALSRCHLVHFRPQIASILTRNHWNSASAMSVDVSSLSCTEKSSADFDRDHLWHPYTSLSNPLPVLAVDHAKRSTLYLKDGTRLLDGMSSWWAAIWGYSHPLLTQALQDQASKMSHVMFGGLTHEPATELGKLLVQMLNKSDERLDRIFYTDSGSVATEVALKMAWQATKKTKILNLGGGYHGDTLGAMSVSDTGMHEHFGHVLPPMVRTERPPADERYSLGFQPPVDLTQSFRQLEQVFSEHHDKLAAIVCEPLVQGAGGMHMYPVSYLRMLQELCTSYNVLLICDEIATGFGRVSGANGNLFAFQEAGIEPDIVCLGKALTAGSLTMGAVVTTERVSNLVSGDEHRPLMHGPTFMANPLACAVAAQSAQILLQETNGRARWEHEVTRIQQQLQFGLEGAAGLENVQDVRVRGAVGVLELKKPLDMSRVPHKCHELGVWLRPFGKLLYTMPPYIMSNEEIDAVTSAMKELSNVV